MKEVSMRVSRPFAMFVVAAVCMAFPSVVSAAFPSTDCFLPSVGRGAGKEGSEWYTRVMVHNPGLTDATVRISFLRRDQSNPTPVEVQDIVPAKAVNIYNDPITELFATTGFGALRIQSDQPVVVLSRIYSEPPEGLAYSVGQLFAAVPTSFAVGLGEMTTIINGAQTIPIEESNYRFNFGLVETAGASATVEIRLYAYTGVERTRKTITVEPNEVRQWDMSFMLPDENAWAVTLEFEVVEGDGRLITFGSLIANKSNDPTTIEMEFGEHLLAQSTDAGGGALPSLHGNW
jgi:hypothetical protein